jgi:hypothetical protein
MQQHQIELFISEGVVRGIYDDALAPILQLGKSRITRASHVEPTLDGAWTADMSPINGPILGPFSSRSAALEAEREFLNKHQCMKLNKKDQ